MEDIDPVANKLIENEDLFNKFKKAVNLFRNKKFNEALTRFNKVQDELVDPFTGIHYFRGEIAFQQHRYEDAYENFVKCYLIVGNKDYINCIERICLLISKNIIIKDYGSLLSLYQQQKSFRILFLLLEQLGKRMLNNHGIYILVYSRIIKKLLQESEHTFLTLYGRLMYDNKLFTNILQLNDHGLDCINSYMNRLDLLTDIPFSILQNDVNFIKIFTEIIYLQNLPNHFIIRKSGLIKDNLWKMYCKKVSDSYRNIFNKLNYVNVRLLKRVDKMKIKLVIICKDLLKEGPLLYKWFSTIYALNRNKQIELILITSKREASSPYARTLIGECRSIYDFSNIGFETTCNLLTSLEPDSIIYLDIENSIGEYLLAHCRFAPLQISIGDNYGISTIDEVFIGNNNGYTKRVSSDLFKYKLVRIKTKYYLFIHHIDLIIME
jgi:hypothetical protein